MLGLREEQTDPQAVRRRAGVDLRQFPLSPLEGFVCSRMDGPTSLPELADLAGMSETDLGPVVKRLLELGVLEWVSAPKPRDTPPASTTTAAAPKKVPPAAVAPKNVPPAAVAPKNVPPAAVAPPPTEDVEIDPERRAQIVAAYSRLPNLTHYEALGVSRDADKQAIRSAYFEQSKLFHPDTMFGKRLGDYKGKMEAIFKRITEAYEILGKKKSREEYDAYLGFQAATRAVQESLEVDLNLVEQEARGAAPDPEGGAPHAEGGPPEPQKQEAMPTRAEPLDLDARRRRAAARISRSLARQTPTPRTQPDVPADELEAAPAPARPTMTASESKAAVVRNLARSLRQVAGVTGGVDRVARLMTNAQHAVADGNLVAAVNSLRLAMEVDPNRSDVAAEHERLRAELARSLADNYQKQAEYEERHGRWMEAGFSWSKVCEGRPSEPDCHIHAADCFLRADGDARRAKSFAERAVTVGPQNADAHRVMGHVLLLAGLKLNAKRELDLALSLAPTNEAVKDLLRQL